MGGPGRRSKLSEAADCLLSKRGGERDRPRKSGGAYRDITSCVYGPISMGLVGQEWAFPVAAMFWHAFESRLRSGEWRQIAVKSCRSL